MLDLITGSSFCTVFFCDTVSHTAKTDYTFTFRLIVKSNWKMSFCRTNFAEVFHGKSLDFSRRRPRLITHVSFQNPDQDRDTEPL